MVVLPMPVPSRSPATLTIRLPSLVSFAAAVTVTDTEAVSAGSVTWWPSAAPSASVGVTL